METCPVLVRSEQPHPSSSALLLCPDRQLRRDVLLGPRAFTLMRRFEPISLAALDDAALLSRADTKYILTTAQLSSLLVALEPHYRLLDIAGQRLHRYQTLYYDTPDYALYRLHHNNARQRFKVRSRRYADTGQSFLEIKLREGNDRTDKRRLPVRGLPEDLTPDMQAFIAACAAPMVPVLVPQIANTFFRLTLSRRDRPERLTLDVGLRLWSNCDTVALPGIVVAEIKQERAQRDSPAAQALRALGCRPDSMSKYCIGVALLYPHVKHNAFLPALRTLHHLMRGQENG